jgi:hypothetical protein
MWQQSGIRIPLVIRGISVPCSLAVTSRSSLTIERMLSCHIVTETNPQSYFCRLRAVTRQAVIYYEYRVKWSHCSFIHCTEVLKKCVHISREKKSIFSYPYPFIMKACLGRGNKTPLNLKIRYWTYYFTSLRDTQVPELVRTYGAEEKSCSSFRETEPSTSSLKESHLSRE